MLAPLAGLFHLRGEQRRALPGRQAGGGVEHNGAGCFGGQGFTALVPRATSVPSAPLSGAWTSGAF